MREFIDRTFCTRWLAEGIQDDYLRWGIMRDRRGLFSPHRVFLESPTGTGKTTFVFQKLLPYFRQMGRVLYLCNRTSLYEQVLHTLWEDVSNKKHFISPRAWKNWVTSPYSNSDIVVMTYQSFLGFLKNTPAPYMRFSYVIFDEAHFFFADALFNPLTYLDLDAMLQMFSRATWVMMSATMHPVVDQLISLAQNYEPKHPDISVYEQITKTSYWMYRNTFSQDCYQIQFYFQENTLLEQIKQTPSEEKWLIFVTSKKAGYQMRQRIAQEIGRTVAFLDSSNKQTKLWKGIVEKAQYAQQVLITTKVLDNGVNILDGAVVHVVLPFCDPIDMIQMLGRKRVEEGQPIHVYCEIPSTQTLQSYLRRTKQQKNVIAKVVTALYHHDSQTQTQLLQMLWMNGEDYLRKLFYIDGNRNLVSNPLARIILDVREKLYTDILAHHEDREYYQKMVLQWIACPPDTPVRILEDCYFAKLYAFLRQYEQVQIPKEEQEAFYQSLLPLLEPCSHMLIESTSVRKGRDRRKKTINDSFKLLNLPYELKKRNNCWVLQLTTVDEAAIPPDGDVEPIHLTCEN